MLGEDQRWQNGFDCQGLWVEVNVERDLGFTSKRDIEALRHRRVRLALQAAGPDLRRPPDRAEHPARDVDGLERPGRAAPAARPARRGPGAERDDRGPDGPGHRHASRCSSGGSGCPDVGGSYFTFSNENNDLIWGFLEECPPARLALQGPRHDAVVRPLRDRPLADGDERGLRRPRGPRADRPPPARRPARRGLLVWTTTPWTLTSNVAAAVGPDLRYVQVRQGEAIHWLGKGTLKQALAGPVRGPRGAAGRGPRRLALRRARSTTCRPSARRSPRALHRSRRTRPTSTASSPGTRSARRRGPASSTSPRAAAPRTSSSARRSGCR